MNSDQIQKAFERFLRTRALKLTAQRQRIFERAFETHEHFSAETLYGWMQQEQGPAVSRATVYRTLGLLLEGGFIDSLVTGRGDTVYEHTLGHRHHDHMVCLECGRIEEFHDPRIEALQDEACRRKGFELVQHDHRLLGYCKVCQESRAANPEKTATEAAGTRGAAPDPGSERTEQQAGGAPGAPPKESR